MRHARITLIAVGFLAALGTAGCSDDEASTAADAPTSSTAPALPGKDMRGVDGPLEPGTWVMPMWGADPDKLPRAVVEVPDGFGSPGGWVVDLGADGDPDQYGNFAFHTVDNTIHDPCEGMTYDDLGPGVRELADALVAQPGHRTSKPAPVTVDGHQGLYLTVTLPKKTRLVACHGSEHTLWRTDDFQYQEDTPGTVEHFWILDVDGTRVVMAAQLFPQQTKADNDKILAMADTVRFLPPLKP